MPTQVMFLFWTCLALAKIGCFSEAVDKNLIIKRAINVLDSLNQLETGTNIVPNSVPSLNEKEIQQIENPTVTEGMESLEISSECHEGWANFQHCYEETLQGWGKGLYLTRKGNLVRATDRLSKTSHRFTTQCSPMLTVFQQCCANDSSCPVEEVEQEIAAMFRQSEEMVEEISKEMMKSFRGNNKHLMHKRHLHN